MSGELENAGKRGPGGKVFGKQNLPVLFQNCYFILFYFILFYFVEFSHNKLMSQIQPVVTRQKNTIRKERTYDVLSIQRESGNGTKNTRKKRHIEINKRKKEKHVWLSWRLHIERRLNEEPRLQKTKTKQNKTIITPEKDVMAAAYQPPGGYKFAPLVASQQGRTNQHEPAYFGYPLLDPSRHARAYYCMP